METKYHNYQKPPKPGGNQRKWLGIPSGNRGGFDGNRTKGRGWMPRKHYNKLPKPRKTKKNHKKQPKPPKLLNTTKT
jgi:hypothetical protein